MAEKAFIGLAEMNEPATPFGKFIEDQSASVSAPQLAEKLNVSDQTMYNWIESNRWPRDTIDKICPILKGQLLRVEGKILFMAFEGKESRYAVEGWIDPKRSRRRKTLNETEEPEDEPSGTDASGIAVLQQTAIAYFEIEFKGKLPLELIQLLTPYIPEAKLFKIARIEKGDEK